MSKQVSIKIEFSGGLELLFDNQRSHRVVLPARVSATPADAKRSLKDDAGAAEGDGRPVDVAYLILWLKDNLLKEREELFVESGTVRPGILVLVNDTDWELEGEGDYQLKDGDEIVFISTLHGG
ncbi:ubiquitin-related modifier 1 [Fomitopsis serialis]|uniref:ubiquitin-related modifier 1 n=1 Tax=Fomitopsis serialis TaxID=139415 RepID=UPI002007C051|nr:ubiquitin-related modifier 1 [Neoantrodia serialis]XP_047894424.1 ubiquitin-related modifier 1 [Neoantrodia serialis]KAH9915392.1 ubiquitin-related modifier 1 [Neoantrodia serialis]KAH9927781.1 ubiquitin-related modifier 1 [Neoantrodia serialis]